MGWRDSVRTSKGGIRNRYYTRLQSRLTRFIGNCYAWNWSTRAARMAPSQAFLQPAMQRRSWTEKGIALWLVVALMPLGTPPLRALVATVEQGHAKAVLEQHTIPWR